MASKKNNSAAASIAKASKAPIAGVGKAPVPAPDRAATATPVSSTPVRNTPIPKAAPARKEISPAAPITHEMVAAKAYEISQSGTGGSELDNWFRAEREIRGV